MKFLEKEQYRQLLGEEADEHAINIRRDVGHLSSQHSMGTWPRTTTMVQSLGLRNWTLLLNICLFLASATLFALSRTPTTKNANWLLQQTSYHSPLYDRFEIEFEDKVVAGTLFDEDSLSDEELLLRSYPNKENDKAWRSRSEVGIITISGEEVRDLGKDPLKTVKAPEDFGFGTDAHLAELDGQHALHCLYAVRRYAYREYYFPEANETAARHGQSPFKPFHQAHLSHCLHILLQTLSCNPSLDVITHNWVETQLYPFPDFNIQKKCISHRQLLDWQSNNRISQEQWNQMSVIGPQRHDTVLAMPRKMREWSEAEDSG